MSRTETSETLLSDIFMLEEQITPRLKDGWRNVYYKIYNMGCFRIMTSQVDVIPFSTQ